MATEDIEGPGGGTVRVVVAHGRTVNAGTRIHSPGEEIEIRRDELGRMIEGGFVHLPGEPRSGGLLVDKSPLMTDPDAIGFVRSEVR